MLDRAGPQERLRMTVPGFDIGAVRMHKESPRLDSGCFFTTIQHFFWQLQQPRLQAVPLDTLEDHMQAAICHVQVDPPQSDSTSPVPQNVTLDPRAKRSPTRNTLDLKVLIMAKMSRDYTQYSSRLSAGTCALASP